VFQPSPGSSEKKDVGVKLARTRYRTRVHTKIGQGKKGLQGKMKYGELEGTRLVDLYQQSTRRWGGWEK